MALSKWLVFATALAMMGASAGFLAQSREQQREGNPGVKVSAEPIRAEDGSITSLRGVLLPEQVPGYQSESMPITKGELEQFPGDTSFGRRLYQSPEGWTAELTVVLMGKDRTSIHQPEYCLTALGWTIDTTERITVPMERPVRYDLPAIKLTLSNWRKDQLGRQRVVRGLYVYWFVSGDKITADPFTGMMRSLAQTIIAKEMVERWAYVSYFTVCDPGQERATFNRLEGFIRATTPEFQMVGGMPNGHTGP